ncbi:MAG: hypothetical protein JST58_07050 [Bacteroidetes bacterium]|nr:hypothetical protein [Bacteroidota bacterium]
MNKILLLTAVLLFSVFAQAQDFQSTDPLVPIASKDSIKLDKFSAGIGVGYEFGGIGGNLIYYPQRNIGIFGGAGYTFVGFGYNAGVKIRYAETDQAPRIDPFIVAMYGYNNTLRYDRKPAFNRTFYNVTIGGGIDFRPRMLKLGYLSVAIYVPFRNPDAKNYNNNYVQWFYPTNLSNKQFPVSASIGYRLVIK